jgi:hypothetical protein
LLVYSIEMLSGFRDFAILARAGGTLNGLSFIFSPGSAETQGIRANPCFRLCYHTTA